jgi:type I restriction enzyme, S subunit
VIHNLKPYPTYKDSGVPWLGQVPEHWEVRSLGSLISATAQRGNPDLPLLSVVREKGVIPRSSMNDDENHNFIPDDLSNYKVVRKGNLVINKMKAWQGSLGIAPIDGVVSPAYYVFDFRIGEAHFGQTLLRSKAYVPFFAQASDGVRIGQWDLSIQGMKRIPVVIPPTLEQASIVRYLDFMDRRIGRYTRAKQKLIKLLEEQRQAIIHRAVTRGLDPDARLKPSGIEWLGGIPEHWTLVQARRLVSFVTSGSRGWARFYSDDGDIFLQSGNLGRRMSLDLSFTQYVQPPAGSEGERTRVLADDILVCITGALTGNVVHIVSDLPLPVFVNQHIALLRPDRTVVHPRYLAYSLHSETGRIQFKAGEYGGTKQGLGLDDVKSTFVPLPPLVEQIVICARLDKELERLSTAIGRCQLQMALIREHRVRLIADVVTGRLDLRETAASLPDEFEQNGLVETGDGQLDEEVIGDKDEGQIAEEAE